MTFSKYSKTRYFYLRGETSTPKVRKGVGRMSYYTRKNDSNPHTCIAIKVDFEKHEIQYSLGYRQSHDQVVALKRRMSLIKELGGEVTDELYEVKQNMNKDFSKRAAREHACRGLNHNPYTIKVANLVELSAHDITRTILRDIVARDDVAGKSSTQLLRIAAKSAYDWLNRYSVYERDTVRQEVAASVLANSIPPQANAE